MNILGKALDCATFAIATGIDLAAKIGDRVLGFDEAEAQRFQMNGFVPPESRPKLPNSAPGTLPPVERQAPSPASPPGAGSGASLGIPTVGLADILGTESDWQHAMLYVGGEVYRMYEWRSDGGVFTSRWVPTTAERERIDALLSWPEKPQ